VKKESKKSKVKSKVKAFEVLFAYFFFQEKVGQEK
jgi:hypothetical protein